MVLFAERVEPYVERIEGEERRKARFIGEAGGPESVAEGKGKRRSQPARLRRCVWSQCIVNGLVWWRALKQAVTFI